MNVTYVYPEIHSIAVDICDGREQRAGSSEGERASRAARGPLSLSDFMAPRVDRLETTRDFYGNCFPRDYKSFISIVYRTTREKKRDRKRERTFLICVKIVSHEIIVYTFDARRLLRRKSLSHILPYHSFPFTRVLYISLLTPPDVDPVFFLTGESARASGWMQPHLNAHTYIGEMFDFMGHFAELYVDRNWDCSDSTKKC